MLADGQQSPGGHRCVGALDPHRFGLTEDRDVVDQPCGGCAEHYPTRRGNRLHPLSHPHLLTDRGITHWTRTDLTGEHPTRIQADPQL
jgi:hypothetical protein